MITEVRGRDEDQVEAAKRYQRRSQADGAAGPHSESVSPGAGQERDQQPGSAHVPTTMGTPRSPVRLGMAAAAPNMDAAISAAVTRRLAEAASATEAGQYLVVKDAVGRHRVAAPGAGLPGQ